MAKKSGLARFAEAAALLTGGGLEGYAKGTMASLVEQRRAALEEIRDRRAAQQALEDREWRTQESEKTREFQRETAAESMAWEKEKFGMEQAADEARTNRTLAAQERLAKLRGAGEDKRTATERDAATYARLKTAAETGDKNAVNALRFFEETQFKKSQGDRDERSAEEKLVSALSENMQKAAQGDKAAQAWVDAFKLNNPARTGADSTTPIQYNRAFLDTLEMIVPIGKTPTAEDRAEARRILAEQDIHPPGGSTEAVPGPTPPPESVSPSQAEQAPPKEIGGDGTREKPLEATSLEELEALYESSTTGTWVRYKNKLYQKK